MNLKNIKKIIATLLVATIISPTLNSFSAINNIDIKTVDETVITEESVNGSEASLDNGEGLTKEDKLEEGEDNEFVTDDEQNIEGDKEEELNQEVIEDNINKVEVNTEKEQAEENNILSDNNKYEFQQIAIPRAATIQTYEIEEFNQKAEEFNNIYLLSTKTDDKYEIALASSDGSYYYVDSTSESIDKAIETANNTVIPYSDESLIPVVIDESGRTVYAAEAMARIYKHIGGKPYPYFDINTNMYSTSSLSKVFTVINQGYVDDAPIIQDLGTSALIQVSGYKGWVNKDTSKGEYDILVYPLNQVTNASYYYVEDGILNHFISANLISTTKSGSTLQLGPAPSFMSEGIKYFSYDGRYFYTNLSILINDLKADTTNNAVNKDPYFSYYNSLPFRSKTFITAKQIDDFISKNVTNTKSKLIGTGQAFIDAQNLYGVNAALMLGVAINESSWGMSSISQEKNNLFGINAVDSDPSQANVFSSVRECIIEFAKNYISRGYSDPADWRYYGGYLGNKSNGANVKYASDPFWGEKAAQHAYSLDSYSSGNSMLIDYNSYQLAVATTNNQVKKADGTLLYNIKDMSSGEYTAYLNTPFIVSNENTVSISGQKCYEINPERDTPVNNGGTANMFGGNYNWNSKGYINTSGVTFINNPTRSYATGINVSGNLYTTETLTFTATASPSTNTLYKLWVCDRTTGEWIVLSDYSNNNTITYMPMNAGNYSFVAHIKNVNSSRDRDDYISIDVTVKGKSMITDLSIEGNRSVGDKLTMVPTAIPAGDTLYKYFVKEPGASDWKVLKDYSTSTSFEYVPTKSGNHNFIVHVKHKDSAKAYDGYKTVDIEIGEKSKVTSLKVTGNYYVGQELTMTADATPSSSTLYKLWVCDRSTNTWIVLSDYSSKNTVKYIPSKPGNYSFVVHVKNKYSTTTTQEDYRSVDVEVKTAKSTVSTLKVTGNAMVNEKLTMTATGTPMEDTLYKLWVCDRSTNTWIVLSDYSTKNTIDYIPTKGGQYSFVVHVKNKYSCNERDDYKSVDVTVTAPTSKVSTLNVTGNKYVNEKLTMTATATPSENTLYKLWVCDRSTNEWIVLSDYSTKNTIEYIPTKAGQYSFVVHVKNKYSGNERDDYKSVDVTVVNQVSKVNTLNVTGNKYVNEKLTMTATATPSDTTLYKLWVCDRSTNEWIVLSDYSTKNTIEYIPTKAGQYSFVVHVKNKYSSNERDDYKSIDVVVGSRTSKVSSISVTGSKKVNEKLTMTATATPADTTLYKLWVCDRSTNVWTVLSDYSTKNSIEYIPTKAGEYSFVVHVKNKNSDLERDDYDSVNVIVK